MAIVELTHESNGVSLLRLNRPEARNALNWEAMDLFAEAVADLGSRPGLRVLLVTGEGEAFCSGGDLFELDQYLSRRDGERLARVMGDALQGLESLPVPTVAAVEGPALGGGAEIALACDIRIMARGSTLGIMHIRLGIAPAWGGGQRLLRLVGYGRALEWMSAGRVLEPEEAERHGLANRVVERSHALREARALANSLVAHDSAAVAAVKRMLRAGINLPASEAALAERREFPDLWAGDAHRAASTAFVARRTRDPQA